MSTARDRVLETASQLFYAEGIRAVGVDRIIAEAGVAKATFYHHFPTKDHLVCAYLLEEHRAAREDAESLRTQWVDPSEVLLRIFDHLGKKGCGPGFRGCPFVNAAAEYPDPVHSVRQVIATHRRWFRQLIHDLLAAAGHPDPDGVARMLHLLCDGIEVGMSLDDTEEIRAVLRTAVTRILGGTVVLSNPRS